MFDNQVIRPASEIHLDPERCWRGGELVDRVSPVSDDLHALLSVLRH
jgi:hypothetical protein